MYKSDQLILIFKRTSDSLALYKITGWFIFWISAGEAPLPKVPARRPKYHRVEGADDPLPSGQSSVA